MCGFVPSSWATEGTRSPPLSSATSLPPASSLASASTLFDFDLPAQPLIDALQRYGTLTRQPALFRSEIVSGRTSSALSGRHSAEAALRLLLGGTGLVAEKFDHGSGGEAFVLKVSVDTPADAARVASLGSLSGYPGLVQTRVWQALCGNPRTVPGQYRSLLRFQVDAVGQIQRPRLIGSTGDAERDAAVLDVLRQVRMGSAPPRDLEQPVTMLLLPDDVGAGMRCDQISGAS